MNAGQRCTEVFATELGYLKEHRYVDFVTRCFDELCPDHFFTQPASLTRKYHPALAVGDGGVVRHTKYAVWWGVQLARALDGDGRNDGEHRDVIVSALLLHDVLKGGDPSKRKLPERQGPGGHSYLTGIHGVDMAEAIYTRVLKEKIEWPEQLLIMAAIAGHMGIWTGPEQYRPNNIQGSMARRITQIVHIADFCAAQKADEAMARIGAVEKQSPAEWIKR